MDWKAANAYLGLQGLYCEFCSFSKQQCHLPEIIEDGFYIDRNIDSIRAIFDELSDEQRVVARREMTTYLEQVSHNAPSLQQMLRRSKCYMDYYLRSTS